MVNKKNDFVAKKLTKELIQTEYVEKERSFEDIAKDLGTYSNRVRRAAIKMGFSLRGHSEAQAAALKTGKVAHPTKGKQFSQESKDKISAKLENAWKNVPKAERKKRADAQRERMMSLTEKERSDMRSKAMKAVRQTRDTGSKLEQAIMMSLRDQGLEVEFHRKNLVANEKLEADIYLPELKVVIESDGISHRENVFGRLRKQKFADSVKNGLLLQHDFVVIRVVDSAKTNSQAYNRRMCAKVMAIINDIQNVQRPTVLSVEDT